MWAEFNLWHPLWFAILGGFVGWFATRAFPGRGLGLRGNVAVSTGGAVLGGLFFYPQLLCLSGSALNDGFTAFDYVVLALLGNLLWFVTMGGLVGWQVGRAYLGLGRPGNVAVGVFGAAASGLLFLLAVPLLGGAANDVCSPGFGIIMLFGYTLWFAILGAVVGWLVGRAFLGFGRAGNVVLAVIGAVGGHFFGLLAPLFVVQTRPGLLPTLCGLYHASFGAVLSLAIVIIFARRR